MLAFIKDGCPCSEAAEPYFHQLHAAYGSRAGFLGVIDGDVAAARDWSVRHATPYPVLADPNRRHRDGLCGQAVGLPDAGDAGREHRKAMARLRSHDVDRGRWPLGQADPDWTKSAARYARRPTDMVSGCEF